MIVADWRKERRKLIVLLVVAATGISWSPYPFLPLALVSLTICGWFLWQSSRLLQWLDAIKQGQNTSVHAPYSSGIWDALSGEFSALDNKNRTLKMRFNALNDRLQDSTSALEDGIVMIDRHGHLEWWNVAAERYLGFRRDVDTLQPITNLLRAPEFVAYFSRQQYDEPLVITAPNKSDIYLEFRITPFGRNERLIVISDVTRLRQLEQMRKDFVANVSHELRTPLTVINGYLETLPDVLVDVLETPHPGINKMIAQMQGQGTRMSAIVQDLLTLSRLETDKTDGTEFIDVQQMLGLIASEVRAMSGERHTIDLQIESPKHLIGFATELRSAFTNLAVNAVRYTPDKGRIALRWYDDGNALCFTVEDNGLGIAPQHIPRLTERFYRADTSRSKETGGTGLGLAIVKHVLLRHHGELIIKSELNKGSCFTAKFPHAQQQTFKQAL
ncbi:MAG: phosphate regulon sensor histidine kinase PhoR [Oleibacter sp.]|nr:phosphate regulon sensor histidine kinase PhoR [Thalassolituus sp.]